MLFCCLPIFFVPQSSLPFPVLIIIVTVHIVFVELVLLALVNLILMNDITHLLRHLITTFVALLVCVLRLKLRILILGRILFRLRYALSALDHLTVNIRFDALKLLSDDVRQTLLGRILFLVLFLLRLRLIKRGVLCILGIIVLFLSLALSSLLILLISVPMAFAGFGYWSMISGTIASNLLLAIWLTACSEWKPRLHYGWLELKAMFSFSVWTLVEQLSIWLTSWIGTFILGSMMNTYYLGLYNTSTSLVNAVVAIIAGAVNPVVFATLSRFQNDRERKQIHDEKRKDNP